MTGEQAKYILRAYRLNGEDSADPQFKEALEMAKQNPDLARWFADEQALDAEISKKFRAFPVPSRVTSQLLVARTIPRPVPWWRKLSRPLAVAALVAGLLTFTILWLPRRDNAANVAGFREAMAKASLEMSSHVDVMGLDASELQKWIAEHDGSTDFELPINMRVVPIGGCKIMDWHGHKVTMLCLKSDGKHFDVFVIPENDLPNDVLNATAQFASNDGVTTAAWRRGGNVYVLASTSSKSALDKLF